MVLDKELQRYCQELPHLLGEEGKFALVHKDRLDVYDTYEDALGAGYEQYGLEPFLVKQIQAAESVHCITRDVFPCA